MSGKQYKITLNEEQIGMIANALDLYSRLFAGQLKEISRVLIRRKEFDVTRADNILNELKRLVFPELEGEAYYGIYAKQTDKVSKYGYDLYKQMMHLLCKDSEFWNVNKEPFLMFASEQQPLEIEVI